MLLTRRTFLFAVAGAAGLAERAVARGQAGGGASGGGASLDAFATGGLDCAPGTVATPAIRPDGTFRAGAPRRTSLVEPGANGPRLVLTGTVAGLKCGPIKDAVLDFWHPDAAGSYDISGFRYRGSQLTDAQGRFTLTTIVPGAAGGRAPHLSVRVAVPPLTAPNSAPQVVLWTEIFLPGDARNARDPRYRPELAMIKRVADATFDIRLDR